MSQKLNYFKTRPKAEPIEVVPYLERLSLASAPASLAYLQKLHRAHLLHVPYENLDIHYGGKLHLNVNHLQRKIVTEKRGGLSYETNGLFYHLLSKLGFQVAMASARPLVDGRLAPEFEHLILLVSLDEVVYLCDVGFGDLMTLPKRLELNTPQLDYTTYFKFTQDADGHWQLRRSKNNSDYQLIYQFGTESAEWIQFMNRCDFHQQSMDSGQRKQKLITQLFHAGRVLLTDRSLVLQLYGEKEEKPVSNEDEFLAFLEQYFKIDSRKLISQGLG